MKIKDSADPSILHIRSSCRLRSKIHSEKGNLTYMKRSFMPFPCFILSVAMLAGMLSPRRAEGQISTPEQIAKQTELEKSIPKMQITDEFLQLRVPDQTMGETVGVAKNSKGHLFV